MNGNHIVGSVNPKSDAIGKFEIRILAKILNRAHQIAGIAFQFELRGDFDRQCNDDSVFRLHGQSLLAHETDFDFVGQ